MTCPYLEYREASFADTERAYCTATEAFVEPMRADICNDRYDLDHTTDCEFYREAERLDAAEAAPDGDARGGEDE